MIFLGRGFVEESESRSLLRTTILERNHQGLDNR